MNYFLVPFLSIITRVCRRAFGVFDCQHREDVSFQFHFLIFLQNFLAANSQCWWNTPLTAATRSLKYAGHVAPGMLLVTAEPCALEILRGAYARSVLKPPATYTISSVGESLEERSLWFLNYMFTSHCVEKI